MGARVRRSTTTTCLWLSLLCVAPVHGSPPARRGSLALPTTPIAPAESVGYLPASWDVKPGGQFAYTIPMDVPAGRAGVQPALALAYSSGGSNGLLGVGWMLTGFSMITRCAHTWSTEGRVDGVDFHDEELGYNAEALGDRFCLDGEKLVKTTGNYGGDGATYRTEQGPYAEILSSADQPNQGPDTFTVKTRAGTIRTYRAFDAPQWTATSEGMVQTATKHHQWLLVREADRSGNYVDYSFTTVSDGTHGVQHVPKRIDYTRHTSSTSSHRFVTFEYEDRRDQEFGWQAGVRATLVKRLKSITMHAPNPTGTLPVWTYRLVYTNSSHSNRSLLASVQKCALGRAGSTAGCLWKKRFAWYGGGKPMFEDVEVLNTNVNTQAPAALPLIKVLDADGDGWDDVLFQRGGDPSDPDTVILTARRSVNAKPEMLEWANAMSYFQAFNEDYPFARDIALRAVLPMDVDGDGSSEVHVIRPTGAGGQNPTCDSRVLGWKYEAGFSRVVTEFPAHRCDELSAYLDVDGDARLDRLSADASEPGSEASGRWRFQLNTGGAFGPASQTQIVSSAKIRLVDFDGDGRGEILGNRPEIRNGWSYPGDPTLGYLDDAGVYFKEFVDVQGRWPGSSQLLDLNGDGLQDALEHGNARDSGTAIPYVRWNTGNGFSPRVPLSGIPQYAGKVSRRFGDVTNDGREDIVVFHNGPGNVAGIDVLRSEGNGSFTRFQFDHLPGVAIPTHGFLTSQLGDFDGNGFTDIIRATGNSADSEVVNRLKVLKQQPHYADRLESVADEGARWLRESIVYSNQWSDKPEQTQACVYPIHCLRRGLVVVREVISRAHFAGQMAVDAGRSWQYSYEGPFADRRGRGFLGFAKFRVWDPARPIETVFTFDNRRRESHGIRSYYPGSWLPSSITQTVPLRHIAKTGPRPGAGGARDQRNPLPYVGGGRVTRTVLTHELKRLNSDRSFDVRTTSWETKEWEQPITIDWGELDADNPTSQHIHGISEPTDALALRRRHGETRFDSFGNVTEAITATDNGQSMQMNSGYENNTTDWLVGLRKTLKTTSTVPDADDGTQSETRELSFEYDAKGRLKTLAVEPTASDASLQRESTFAYNARGMITRVTTTSGTLPPRELRFEYTPVWPNQPDEAIHPSQIWAPFTHNAWRPSLWPTIHPAYGVLISLVNANGHGRLLRYDALGRLIATESAGHADETIAYSAHLDGFGGFDGVTTTASVGGEQAKAVADGLGRIVSASTRGFTGLQHMRVRHDALGRVAAVSRPSPTSEPTHYTRYRYDPLDRLFQVARPDNTEVRYGHEFSKTSAIDAAGNQSVVERNIDGQVIRSTQQLESQALVTSYRYGAFGLLRSVTDPGGSEVHLSFDRLGRIKQRVEPNSGTKTFDFNGFGELTRSTHVESGETSDFTYDSLGRLTTIENNDGATVFAWDSAPNAIGALAETLSPQGVKTRHFYDSLGRAFAVEQEIDGETLRLSAELDAQARPTALHYPGSGDGEPPGLSLRLHHNSSEYLSRIRYVTNESSPRDLWRALARNADDALTSAQSGDSVVHTYAYKAALGQIERIRSANGSTTLFDLKYDYWPNGLVRSRRDQVVGRKEGFGFDALNRLTEWRSEQDGQARSTSYTYDSAGNLKTTTVNGDVIEKYTYGLTAGRLPHAITRRQEGQAGSDLVSVTNYTYDTSGRLLTGGNRTVDAYTAFDLPKSVSVRGETYTFRYNAFGERAEKRGPDGTTVYLGEHYERRTQASGVDHIFHVVGPDGPIAQIERDDANSAPVVNYLASDALGTVNASIGASGSVTARRYFEPFGRRIGPNGAPLGDDGASTLHKGFTGHEHDSALRLINMKGRLYDPDLKRLLTPDPHVMFPLLGQSWNRYSYVMNSPLNLTDPTGFDPDDHLLMYEDASAWSDGDEFPGAGGVPTSPSGWVDLSQGASGFGGSSLGWGNFGAPGGPLMSDAAGYSEFGTRQLDTLDRLGSAAPVPPLAGNLMAVVPTPAHCKKDPSACALAPIDVASSMTPLPIGAAVKGAGSGVSWLSGKLAQWFGKKAIVQAEASATSAAVAQAQRIAAEKAAAAALEVLADDLINAAGGSLKKLGELVAQRKPGQAATMRAIEKLLAQTGRGFSVTVNWGSDGSKLMLPRTPTGGPTNALVKPDGSLSLIDIGNADVQLNLIIKASTGQ
jgi:RHS repeat-associated protein